jgi:hypothetical protein
MTAGLEHYANVFKSTDPPQPSPRQSCAPKVLPINTQQLARIIERYPSFKAMGPDGIHIRVLKVLAGSQTFLPVLHNLFSLCYSTGITPKAWNQSILFLLVKNKEEPYPDQSRPIALTPMLRRLFEKALLFTWSAEKPAWAEQHPGQAGFRTGYSTMSHILTADTLTKQGFSKSVFLDLKQAYDSVTFATLRETLARRGADRRTLNLVESLMCRDASSTLLVNGASSPTPLRRNIGLFQGSALSPTLFNVVIDVVAHQVEAEFGGNIILLLFADDILIKARTDEFAQAALSFVTALLSSLGLSLNHAKSAAVGCSAQGLPEPAQYKYLGAPHEAQGINWPAFLEQQLTKADALMTSLWEMSEPWHVPTRLIILKTFVRPTAEYCLPACLLWLQLNPRPALTAALQAFHLKCLSFVFRTARPRTCLEVMSHLPAPHIRMHTLIASASRSLFFAHPDNPVRRLLNSMGPGPWSASLLLPRLRHHPLLMTWLASAVRHQAAFVSWSFHITRELGCRFLAEDGVLQHYIRPRALVNHKTDIVLTIRDPAIAQAAILWRRNGAFLNRICSACGEAFNRGHITRCAVLERHPTHDQAMANRAYQQDIVEIQEELVIKGYFEAFHYTTLDFYLNNSENLLFFELFNFLDSFIVH